MSHANLWDLTTPNVGKITSCVMPFAALAINQIDLTVK